MDDNILPLINVVFLLLIFFVLAGAITQSAPFDITLPTSHQSKDKTIPTDQVLSIAAGGQLAFGGKTVEPDELGRVFADWPADQPLQVRADNRLKALDLSATLVRLRGAGIAEVHLLTQHQRP